MILQAVVWVKCTGEAHSNPYIDHCFVCIPWWGDYPTCPVCGRKVRQTPKKYRCDHCKIYLREGVPNHA
jgi:hypothetical protein